MEVDFTVTFDYGDEGPGEGEPSPTADDVCRWIHAGMAAEGIESVDLFCAAI